MCRGLVSVSSTVVLALSLLGVTGCPPTDDYYVKKGGASSGGTGSGGVGTSGATGGKTTTSEASGGDNASCEDRACAADCCDGTCTNLATDSVNCGSCGEACSDSQVCRAGSCHGWTSMAVPPAAFVARQGAAYAEMGDRLFIFGGLDADGHALGDGAIYDPSEDSWALVTVDANTPSPRQLASAIWTGTNVIVVGGTVGVSTSPMMGVASYVPSTDKWAPRYAMDTPRVAPYLAHDGGSGQLLVWGGYDASGAAIAGGEYFSAASDGTPIPNLYCTYATCQSVAISELTWANTGDGALMFGGRWYGTTASQAAYTYDQIRHQWTPIPSYDNLVPSARWGAFGVWDGASLFVWGGKSDSGLLDGGSRYARSAMAWARLSSTSLLSARWAPRRRTGWGLALGEGDVVFLGGLNASGEALTDGARYLSADDHWETIGAWPSGEAHEYGVAAAIDGEVFVWGGLDGSTVTATGERWVP